MALMVTYYAADGRIIYLPAHQPPPPGYTRVPPGTAGIKDSSYAQPSGHPLAQGDMPGIGGAIPGLSTGSIGQPVRNPPPNLPQLPPGAKRRRRPKTVIETLVPPPIKQPQPSGPPQPGSLAWAFQSLFGTPPS